MKSLKGILAAGLFVTSLTFAESSEAAKRVYVRIAPPKAKSVTVVKVKRPHKNAVWAAGYWHWNGKKHVWKKGRWIKHRKGFVYVPGHWKNNRFGWYWTPGRWKRV